MIKARPTIENLIPYQSARRIGHVGSVWLNANEAGSSPDFLSAELRAQLLHRYPNAQPENLLQAYTNYANQHGAALTTQNVLATRGADEGIELLIRCYCEPYQDAIIHCTPTYGMYAISAQTADVAVIDVPLLADSRALNEAELLAKLPKAKLLFLCSPNNPTGDLLSRALLLRLLEAAANTTLVVLDEAYIEFFPQESVIDLLASYPNLVITRTLSKAFGLAGIRCGFVLAHAQIIEQLKKVIAPYPIPTPVSAVAELAVSATNVPFMTRNVANVNQAKNDLVSLLRSLSFVTEIFPAHGNFMLVRFKDSATVFQAMLAQGVVLRDFSTKPSLSHCIRLSIGTKTEMDAVTQVLASIENTGHQPEN